eukprot:m.153063 g.153063  ORF g.153063 m.153063 type:complete len:81 (+) comp38618_c2_seq2:97-339(+)
MAQNQQLAEILDTLQEINEKLDTLQDKEEQRRHTHLLSARNAVSGVPPLSSAWGLQFMLWRMLLTWVGGFEPPINMTTDA